MKKEKKLKVVWLCHFSNKELNNYFSSSINEFAPWINELIKIFNNKNDIRLYLICPNIFNNNNYKLKQNNIVYYLYKYKKNIKFKILKILLNKTSLIYRLNTIIARKNIKKIINKIGPDLIHLHGVENPRYSSGLLSFIGEIPELVTIQGFITKSTVAKSKRVMHKKNIERKLLQNCKNFGVRTIDSIKYIKKFNSHANFYLHNYPYMLPNYRKNLDKNICSKYDFVFFTRICKDKGIEDLLFAMKYVKQIKPQSKLLVIGKSSPNYLIELKRIVTKLELRKNVIFTGFLQTQDEVHKLVSKAKICIHPSYHDNLPSTIIESMYIGLPVITYNVDGIDILNKNRESIILVNKGNSKKLGKKMIDLLLNKNKARTIIENARITVKKFYDSEKIYYDLLKIYKNIIL